MRTLFLLCVAGCLTLGCGSDNDKAAQKEAEEQATNNPYAAIQKAAEQVSKGSSGDAKAVDHRSLKEMLDETVSGGFERTSYSSQSTGAMGFNVSVAEAKYQANGDRNIKVSIVDTGGMGMALMGMAAWSSMEVDREDQYGWERTSTFMGYKSFEKYNKNSQMTELAVIIENRFIVTLDGTNCDMDDLKDFAKEIEIGDLKKLI